MSSQFDSGARAVARSAWGILECWRETGIPEIFDPLGGQDFECD